MTDCYPPCISGAYTGPGGGGSASSPYKWPLCKIGSTDYEFPVGNGTLYRPVSVSGLSGSAAMTVQYFRPIQDSHWHNAELRY